MISPDFVKAGRAIFTVSNVSGQYYTYRVVKKGPNGSFPESFFVSLLHGPDNESDYTYLGLLNPANGGIVLTKSSKFNEDGLPVRVVRWALKKVWTADDLPNGYDIVHAGKCGRCGRMLTVPDSIESGIGPECFKRIFGSSHA